ncbi:hypothetical protein Ddye_000842 [Dipteronia dyeriana]|uniref:RNase H type-1 domain-containing protein n=1 Tax=Dipteronia dyeriana TaxID=168575 RepID=A0AAD9XN27_9ROSI|nr:hypothetical protein Ddye_000842 [Dipteronia dyeriana]
MCKGITKTGHFNMEWYDWMLQSLKCNTMVMGRISAYLLFAVTMWFIWKWRCKSVFDTNFKFPIYAVKLNVDGSLTHDLGTSPIGGVIRNHEKSWIEGSALNIGFGCIVEAELWGIFEGLQFMWKTRFKKVVVETVSMTSVCLLINNTSINHSLFSIIHACKALMDKNRCCNIQHVYREGNRVADGLAKL